LGREYGFVVRQTSEWMKQALLVPKSIEPKREERLGMPFLKFELPFLVCMQANHSNSNHKPYF
jgi:hypothetical protein